MLGRVNRRPRRGVPGVYDLIFGIAVFHLVAPSLALAYLDPITGSLVLQILAAGFLAAAATFRRSREWVTGFLTRLAKGRDN
jgi:hypothetical protein